MRSSREFFAARVWQTLTRTWISLCSRLIQTRLEMSCRRPWLQAWSLWSRLKVDPSTSSTMRTSDSSRRMTANSLPLSKRFSIRPKDSTRCENRRVLRPKPRPGIVSLKRCMKLTKLLFATLAIFQVSTAAGKSSPESPPTGWMDSALKTISSPFQRTHRWDYIMSARVRLLVFWIGAEDVGGGYIAKGTLRDEPSSNVVRLVIGSDPLKAPRKINHWGAAMEIRRTDDPESTFFGFMK